MTENDTFPATKQIKKPHNSKLWIDQIGLLNCKECFLHNILQQKIFDSLMMDF